MRAQNSKLKTQIPIISVVIPVYNAARYLDESLTSTFAQTGVHFEVICVDDASTDDSWQLLQKWARKHKNMRVFRLKKNQGLSVALNLGISKAKGDYIARMDGDDIMLPHRLSAQLNRLSKDANLIGIGGQCIRIDENGNEQGIKSFPLTHSEIHSMIFRASPLQHPTLMVNKTKLPNDFAWYRADLKIGEDYDLYYRLMKYGKLANLDQTVIKYREHKKNLTLSSAKRSFWFISKSRFLAVFKYGYVPDLYSFLMVIAQTVLVALLPERILYPLHMKTRSLHVSKTATI